MKATSEELEDGLKSYKAALERRVDQIKADPARDPQAPAPDLVELDRWYRTDLRKAIAERKPEAYITQEELVGILKWKHAVSGGDGAKLAMGGFG